MDPWLVELIQGLRRHLRNYEPGTLVGSELFLAKSLAESPIATEEDRAVAANVPPEWSEIEKERLTALQKALKDEPNEVKDEAALRERYCGPLGYHEVLHLAYVYAETVEEYLVNHPAIILDPTAYTWARTAMDNLLELYQCIGRLEYQSEND